MFLLKNLEIEYNKDSSNIRDEISDIKKQINEIDSKIKIYNNNLKLISENYDELIEEYENKIIDLESQISDSDKHIGEWNEMNELFSKTLRYGLLDTLIPHVNKSIKYETVSISSEKIIAVLCSNLLGLHVDGIGFCSLCEELTASRVSLNVIQKYIPSLSPSRISLDCITYSSIGNPSSIICFPNVSSSTCSRSTKLSLSVIW